jgi:hypothetical protein
MREGSFEHEAHIEVAPQVLSDFLVEHRNHPRFHPLIVSVREVPPPAGVLRRFLLTDRLLLGPLHFKITYRADVLKAGPDEMLTEAFQSPGTYVTNRTTFQPEGTGTRLHETITLRAPDLLFNYAFSQARAAHTRLVANLKRVMEES